MRKRTDRQGKPWQLTRQEWAIVCAVSNGYTKRSDLEALFVVSKSTMRFHLHNIFCKMGAKCMADIVVLMQHNQSSVNAS